MLKVLLFKKGIHHDTITLAPNSSSAFDTENISNCRILEDGLMVPFDTFIFLLSITHRFLSSFPLLLGFILVYARIILNFLLLKRISLFVMFNIMIHTSLCST